MCQGLPYWASGEPQLLSPCYNYRLQRTNMDPLWACSFEWTDCQGVLRSISLDTDITPSTNVCAISTPVFIGTGNPPIVNPTGTATFVSVCGEDPIPEIPDVDPEAPTVPCGGSVSYNGGRAFPSDVIVTLGSGIGVSTFTFVPAQIPDKFMLYKYDGVNAGQLIYDSGYRGDIIWQDDLNLWLADRGLPPEPIVGSNGNFPFGKTVDYTKVLIRVYAPIPNTAWRVTLSCPT